MEDYAAKMQAKSAAELRQYVSRYAEYRDDAVLAALAELRRRGLPAPEEAALRPALEVAVAQQQATAAKAAAASPRPDDPADADAPELYSQGTIVLFSMLFSMLAGGILLGLNLRRLRRTGALARLAAFVLALSVARGLALAWALTQFSNNLLVLAFLPFLFDVVGTVVYLAWFWPRYVGPQEYRPRGWLILLVLCLALSFALRPVIMPMLVKSGLVPPTAPAKK